jgi:hypothetical protein
MCISYMISQILSLNLHSPDMSHWLCNHHRHDNRLLLDDSCASTSTRSIPSKANPTPSARQATSPRGSFSRAKLTTSDNFGLFLTHVTTFHDHRMTLTTTWDDFWWPRQPTLKTLRQPRWLLVKTLRRPWRLLVKTLQRPLWASWLPCDYSPWCHWRPMWQPWQPCAHNWLWPSDEKDDKVTTKMTDDREWWHGKFKWWTLWLLLTTPDDPSDDQNTTPTTLTTLCEDRWQSMWWPGDDTHNFCDDIWWFHLAIFIAKVESGLSCCIIISTLVLVT